jgi:hypothetical protein
MGGEEGGKSKEDLGLGRLGVRWDNKLSQLKNFENKENLF